MRLDKYLAETAQCTRSEAKTLLNRGRVTVNGAVCKKGDTQLREGDSVAVDGAPLAYQQFVYLMLNKPRGYVCTLSDEKGRPTVAELVRGCGERVYPVGRLDLDSEGLLLLTNDGDLAHRILSPRHGVWKRYYAEHEGRTGPEDVRAFEQGLVLADGLHCLPAKLTPLSDGHSIVCVQEGKYHQVRRMLASRGCPVTYLRREAEGGLTLGSLPLGQTKELDIVEAEGLLQNIL